MTLTINRRGLLAGAAAGLATAGRTSAASSGEFSIALGGGAARGLAHIVVLESLDELGVKPAMISATSMGSIIGASYASGMSGREIREYAIELFSNRINTLRHLFPNEISRWGSIFSGSGSALLDPEEVMSTALPDQVPETFAELKTEMRIVTTDFATAEELVLSEGPLPKAIGASSALPVILAPVRWGDRLLIDGGFVNPTPFDIVSDRPGPVIAVDVTGNGEPAAGTLPGPIDVWIGSFQIALHSLVNERLKRVTPNLLIRPDVTGFGSMEFHRIEDILASADADKDKIKRELEGVIGRGI